MRFIAPALSDPSSNLQPEAQPEIQPEIQSTRNWPLPEFDQIEFDPTEATGGILKATGMIDHAFRTKGKSLPAEHIASSAKSATDLKRNITSAPDVPEQDGHMAAIAELRNMFPSFADYLSRRDAILSQLMTPISEAGLTPSPADLAFAQGFAGTPGIDPAVRYSALLAPYEAELEKRKANSDLMKLAAIKELEGLDKGFEEESQNMRVFLQPLMQGIAKNFGPKPVFKVPAQIEEAYKRILDQKTADDIVAPAIENILTYVYGPLLSDGSRRGGALDIAIANNDMEAQVSLSGMGAMAASAQATRQGNSSASQTVNAKISDYNSLIKSRERSLDIKEEAIRKAHEIAGQKVAIAKKNAESYRMSVNNTYALGQQGIASSEYRAGLTAKTNKEIAAMRTQATGSLDEAIKAQNDVLDAINEQRKSITVKIGQLRDANGNVSGSNRKLLKELQQEDALLSEAYGEELKKLRDLRDQRSEIGNGIQFVEDDEPGN